MSHFKRSILSDKNAQTTVALLQENLVTMLDLALQLKQAHWNVVGANFRSIHLQLDEIIDTVRMATDEVAERIVQIGSAPDGRAATIAESSKLPPYAGEFVSVPKTVTAVADRLSATVNALRDAIAKLDEPDPVSQDMFIAISEFPRLAPGATCCRRSAARVVKLQHLCAIGGSRGTCAP